MTAAADITISPPLSDHQRLSVLDGWRGVSIISVLACHLLPLGPKAWNLNPTAGPFGMAIFFTLSGFLITTNLLHNPSVKSFFIRRACRILPLAYLFVLVTVLIWQRKGWNYALAYGTFSINYLTQYVTTVTSPLWSLCVEVHFYIAVGLLVALAGKRGLLLLPIAALIVTGLRIWTGTSIANVTHLRVDEILAGATVALIHANPAMAGFRARFARVPAIVLLAVFVICCHPATGPLNYLRPYAAAMLVAGTLWQGSWLATLMRSRVLKYVAEVSFALYVIHPINRIGWFAQGGKIELYLLKRPIGLALTFLLAHLSTFHYEKWWIERGKRWAKRAEHSKTKPTPLVAEPALQPALVKT
jgi:peptidoglycan/LPS O-acetylase OafA/YrhL